MKLDVSFVILCGFRHDYGVFAVYGVSLVGAFLVVNHQCMISPKTSVKRPNWLWKRVIPMTPDLSWTGNPNAVKKVKNVKKGERWSVSSATFSFRAPETPHGLHWTTRRWEDCACVVVFKIHSISQEETIPIKDLRSRRLKHHETLDATF